MKAKLNTTAERISLKICGRSWHLFCRTPKFLSSLLFGERILASWIPKLVHKAMSLCSFEPLTLVIYFKILATFWSFKPSSIYSRFIELLFLLYSNSKSIMFFITLICINQHFLSFPACFSIPIIFKCYELESHF